MAVQVLARPVVAHRCSRIGVSGRDLHVAEIDPRVEHRGDECVSQHVWMHAGQSDAGICGEVVKPPGGGVSVHAGAAPVEQQCPDCSIASSSIDGPAHRRWQWDKDDLAALASDSENAVAMLFAEVVNVGSNGLKDPRAEQAEQAHQREVERAARLPSCGQHCLELQVGQSERR